MASSADELLDFFNHYDDKTDDEASSKTNGTTDPEGTAIVYDLGYHFIVMFGYNLVMDAIAYGGYMMYHHFGHFN